MPGSVKRLRALVRLSESRPSKLRDQDDHEALCWYPIGRASVNEGGQADLKGPHYNGTADLNGPPYVRLAGATSFRSRTG